MRFRIRMFNVLLEFKGFLMVHVKTIMFIIIVIIIYLFSFSVKAFNENFHKSFLHFI